MSALFIGVGVGPGDPELITLKAARLIGEADVISYICNEAGQSQAKNIASAVLGNPQRLQDEIPIFMPMSEDRSIANGIYDQSAVKIQAALDRNRKVVFLCEGDPLFFGSFGYLLERLKAANACLVVPGISSVQAASSALQLPLTVLTESFAVVSGRHSETEIVRTLQQHDSVVIMKAGRARQKILQALARADRTADARYLEYIGRPEQVIREDIEQLRQEPGPYFSLFVVTRSERGHR
ncbi:precorrin-2 C(20)-methyltransferase [Ketobacter sp. MCCC 1A13808]|uniref:precorrin-2 C(20)-methyltransferase n=1 Tax=Ketobacter sp. MCCC 1A13808 TaxID=2602738 RepID=UPI000F136669|nr:precorrin-2 C(20)-methyltransferase [Ketobacter sp. MCCC 1A13808]MVF13626.1 precorrin-2 C(20)-methyltransferase [Ketobacter sp. MCCC 1A13808]RLP53125.1 MAG: precorrin-2 C(20)-methyltransferase [Ketobacter sp.]